MAQDKDKPNKGGRTKGTPNAVTTKAREMFIGIMAGEMPHVKEELKKLRTASPYSYLTVVSKMMPYFMPKQIDITTNDEPLPAPQVIVMALKED